jgi:predicted naringenin-chalcone synthase
MFLKSIASAHPDTVFTQRECWDILCASPARDALRPRSMSLMEKVLTGDSGIETRHFCIEDPLAMFTLDAGSLNARFEAFAPEIAGRALTKALAEAGLHADELDALIVCTCTGYICPGVSSHVAERIGLRGNAYLQDVVGLGCGAAIPTLRAAQGFLSSHPEARVAVIAVEICSAAFFLNDEPGVLISLCLFGDGASASIWEGADVPDKGRGDRWQAGDFATLHQPEHREKIRFVNDNGKLRNQLHRSVPQLAAEAVSQLFRDRAEPEPDHILCHTGGRDVLDAVEGALGDRKLPEARAVLRRAGNMSSPCVLMALEDRLRSPRNTDDQALWLTAFGAGFSTHACALNRRS